MQQCDPRLMTPREIVSELASILASGYLRHVKARRFMDEGSPLPADVAQPEESQDQADHCIWCPLSDLRKRDVLTRQGIRKSIETSPYTYTDQVPVCAQPIQILAGNPLRFYIAGRSPGRYFGERGEFVLAK